MSQETEGRTVGELADRADHHPDILIQYSKVTLTLSSHDKGGVTDRDLRHIASEMPAVARLLEAVAKARTPLHG